MKKWYGSIPTFLVILAIPLGLFAQPADGENEYALTATNPRFLAPGDTIDTDAGRGVWVADDPDLDGDGLPEILVTEYLDGGRVFVFEMIADNTLEFVWASPKLTPGIRSSEQSPRSITTGDFDSNGKQEIWFQIGSASTDSLERAQRGIYVYEFTGDNNDYGDEPIHFMPFEAIDSSFADLTVMRTSENGMIIDDIDGDGKQEFIYPPRTIVFATANLYILEAESGTFENGDIVIEEEFVYTGMAQALGSDGFAPVGATIGDIDSDGLDEIVVAGWTVIQQGGGLGFIEITGQDTYTPGSVITLSTSFPVFDVKAKPLIVDVNGEPVIYVHGGESSAHLWVLDGIVSDQFVSESNLSVLMRGVGAWSAWDWGDQDHPTQSTGDGFDLYLNGGGFNPKAILDIEYDGVGSVTDSSSYTIHTIFDLDDIYDSSGGLWNDFYVRPGMDLDRDGRRDIVASYKGSFTQDTLDAKLFNTNTYAVFFFEWGDSTSSIDLVTSVPERQDLTIITPENFELEQNYPNPFNPTTNITFRLPINKTVSLKIYNSVGQEVRTLIDNQTYPQGAHTVQWNATDNNGSPVASGVYIYKLIFGNFAKSNKMTLVR